MHHGAHAILRIIPLVHPHPNSLAPIIPEGERWHVWPENLAPICNCPVLILIAPFNLLLDVDYRDERLPGCPVRIELTWSMLGGFFSTISSSESDSESANSISNVVCWVGMIARSNSHALSQAIPLLLTAIYSVEFVFLTFLKFDSKLTPCNNIVLSIWEPGLQYLSYRELMIWRF